MKKVFFFLLLVVAVGSHAQNVSSIRGAQSPDGWVLLKDTANVQLSVKEINCNGNSIFLVKIVNNNASAVTAKWSFWKLGDDQPAIESYRQVTVDPNGQQAGECPDPLTMTVSRPLFQYLYNGNTINDLVLNLLIS